MVTWLTGSGVDVPAHSIRGAKADAEAGDGDAAGKATSEGSKELVTSTPESRHRRVLALPLVRRPLIPGVMMQVPVSCPTLAAKLKELTAPMGYARPCNHLVLRAAHVVDPPPARTAPASV